MAEIPESKNTIEKKIYKYYELHQEPPRPHIGASELGNPCERAIWLKFRLAVIEKFNGRMLLLFDRGQREEERIINHLRNIGVRVTHTGNNQMRFSFGSHVAGSCDGIIEGGLPNAPKARAILECKTHSDKSFNDVKKKGVEKSKPNHWIQCNIYGYGAGIDRALYVAVNKNNDEIYTEWLHLDKAIAQKYIERGQRIALEERIPPPISTDPSWFSCKFCPSHSFCFDTHLTKEVTCRTCAHSTPKTDSTWRCERYGADDIPFEYQLQGCDCHSFHPDLVPWKPLDGPDDWTAAYEINGQYVANGEPDVRVYSSKEILANPEACALGDDRMEAFRDVLGAIIVG